MTVSRLPCYVLCVVLISFIVVCVEWWFFVQTADKSNNIHKEESNRHYLEKLMINKLDSICSERSSKLYLAKLCKAYASGYITGSLCKPLCTMREIHVQKCIGGHGWKPFVLKAKWNSKPLIIKSLRHLLPTMVKSSNLLSEMHDSIDVRHNSWRFELTQEEFINKANVTLFKSVFVEGKTQARTVVKLLQDSVAAECITKYYFNRKLRNIETLNCWQLIASKEYIVTSLMQGEPHIPDLKGVCGDMYALEYVPPLDSDQFLGVRSVLSGQWSWNSRARLALALLDMVEFAEGTPYGTLHFCDVKESNFGVSEKDGELVVKMIDLDDSWFGSLISSIAFERRTFNMSCNSDCNFDSCRVECDITTGTCSNRLLSNNLQTICQRILTKPHFWQPSLLQNPPTSIKQPLETLLHQCANPKDAQTHIPKDLMKNLRALLQSSIEL